MAEIRIDQSHCNSYLCEMLSLQKWEILFKDPGRASRGGSGSQGDALRIFESSGLPIPDIVGIRGSCLLLIEIDSIYSKAEGSLKTYRDNESFILNQFHSLSPSRELSELALGFCRTNATKKPHEFFTKLEEQVSDIDLWVAFAEARKPLCHWVKATCA